VNPHGSETAGVAARLNGVVYERRVKKRPAASALLVTTAWPVAMPGAGPGCVGARSRSTRASASSTWRAISARARVAA
jgi:hypothetical protein